MSHQSGDSIQFSSWQGTTETATVVAQEGDRLVVNHRGVESEIDTADVTTR
ncbi:hypothetical protein [Streptomyces sp. NPDC057557]|uniref:hypothetical protein n=1 Tax=Streptomyces sp. NPDC057557 TaxID=3346167 RepID=UPI003695B842